MTPENIKYIIDSVSNANLQRSVDNFDRRCEKFLEELGELAEARLGYTSKNNPKNKTLNDVKEEAVDVLIVALDISLTPFSFFSSTDEIKNELSYLYKSLSRKQSPIDEAKMRSALKSLLADEST